MDFVVWNDKFSVKIASIDEYWGDDGETPKWRLDMEIGKRIR